MYELQRLLRPLRASLREVGSRGLLVVGVVLSVVALLLVPLPTPLLDVLLVFNLTLSLALLLMSLLGRDSLPLFSFPTILLLTTLYRLALNVSSTRLILLNGGSGLNAAGQVIESFGTFVVRGDFFVGAMVFAIIAIVNFLVITRGASRVAEVAARFTLDALPGKQLALDADFRLGNLSREEVEKRRAVLEQESQFYGGMDGAMKFVQGDAIAGFVITFINIVGGVSIGLSSGMDITSAINTYGILTIGDGLVNVLPSLLISVCAGLIVTRVSGQKNSALSEDIVSQLSRNSDVVVVTCVVMMVLGLLPGWPMWPFFLVSSLLLFWALRLPARHPSGFPLTGLSGEFPAVDFAGSSLPRIDQGAREPERGSLLSLPSPSESFRVLSVELDSVALAPLFEARMGQGTKEFHQAYLQCSRQIFRKRGIVLPQVVLGVGSGLPPSGYAVQVREQLMRSGALNVERVFVVASQSFLRVFGFPEMVLARHPMEHRQAAWVARSEGGLTALRRLGIEVLSAQHYLALEAAGAALEVIEEIIGVSEIRKLLEGVRRDHPQLMEEIFDNKVLSYIEFAEVLKHLIREHVNIRDLKLILEGVSEFSARNIEVDSRSIWLEQLHEFLRGYLARTIIADLLGPTGKLRTFVLSRELEDEFRAVLPHWDRIRTPPLEPAMQYTIRQLAATMFAPVLERGSSPIVLLCPQDIRAAVQEFFLDRTFLASPWVRTVSYEELQQQYKPESVGVLSI